MKGAREGAGRVVGSYQLFDEFASGGTASVHYGRLLGDVGFSRLVAIKRLHRHLAKDAELVAMFLDEARVAGRVRHPNVGSVLDVIREGEEVLLVLDYVHGEPLSRLIQRARELGEKVPPAVAVAIGIQTLHGLHAAHEARSETGAPLEIVHRDVSPQNIMVGVDGVARVVDFGIAKAMGRAQHTAEGQLKGKLGYFAPEQFQHRADRRTDVFAASVVLWEALRTRRLFTGDTHWEIAQAVLSLDVPSPAASDPSVPPEVGRVVLRGLARDPQQRYPTAEAMAAALSAAGPAASASEVGAWVERLVGRQLEDRRERLARSEGLADVAPPPSVRLSAEPPPGRRASDAPRAEATGADVAPDAAPRLLAAPAPRRAAGWPIALAIAGLLLGAGGLAFGLYAIGQAQSTRGPAGEADPEIAAETEAEEATVSPRRRRATAAPSQEAPPPSADASAAEPSSPRPAPPAPPDAASSRPAQGPAAKACQTQRECSSLEACEGGRCVCVQTSCNGACVHTGSNASHCGACGAVCAPPSKCIGGRCVSCRPELGMSWCGVACVNLQANGAHCGACNQRCARACVRGKCDPP